MDREFVASFNLKPLELSDRFLLKKFSEQLSQPLAEHSFASWFIWGKPLNVHWTVFKEYLCIFLGDNEEMTLFIPPLKSADAYESDFANVVRFVFEVMDSWNQSRRGKTISIIDYVPDTFRSLFDQLQDSLEIVPSGTDYVYDTKAMIELAGSSLKSKRHAKTKFMRDFPQHVALVYEDQFKQDCLKLLQDWADHRKTQDQDACNKSNVALADLVGRDFNAVKLALDHWKELGLSGMVVYVADKLTGFTFGEALTSTQASILIEKTDPDYPGCPQFLFSEFCRSAWQGFHECNAGDDWGIPNLSFTKMSYRPKKLLPKYMVRYKAS
jgi:hypothetical protein